MEGGLEPCPLGYPSAPAPEGPWELLGAHFETCCCKPSEMTNGGITSIVTDNRVGGAAYVWGQADL